MGLEIPFPLVNNPAGDKKFAVQIPKFVYFANVTKMTILPIHIRKWVYAGLYHQLMKKRSF